MSGNAMNDITDAVTGKDPAKSAFLIYILYLVGLAFPVLPLIGVVLAYMFRKDATGFVESHNTYQIRTFWIGLAYSILSMLLMIILIGWIVGLAALVWYVVRCVKGLQLLSKRQPVPDPQTWMV